MRARCGYWGCSVAPFIRSQSGGMVTPQSPPCATHNSSPGRPSPGEVVQIPDAVCARCGYFPLYPLVIHPPPRGGGGHLAQKAWKILGTAGAKEKFFKAPKLIHTVILWYSFVVQSCHFVTPPPVGGGTVTTLGGESTRGGVGLGWDRASHRRALQASASFPARHWSQILAVRFQGRAD